MLFHLIRWFWSLSNKLNLYLLVDGQGVGWEWLMVKTVFSDEPLEKWQTCHILKFPFVIREHITRWPGSRVHKCLFPEKFFLPRLVWYWIFAHSKIMDLDDIQRESGCIWGTCVVERTKNLSSFCRHASDVNFPSLYFLIWKVGQTVKDYIDENCHSIPIG